MMLTAIPANPNPSVFAHNHTPPVVISSSPSQPASPDTVTQAQTSTHVLRGGMDNKGDASSAASSGRMPPHAANSTLPPAQLIPMTAVQQPFVLGAAGGTGYALVPSIQPISTSRSSDVPMLGLHPLGTLPRPPGGATMQQLAAATAIPSGYYSRVQSEVAPIGFQQPVQQLPAASLSPPTQLSARRPDTPTSSAQLPPAAAAPPHPHTLLISGTGNGVIMNGSSLESKPGLAMMQQSEQAMVPRVKSSPLSLSSPQTHQPSRQENPLNKTGNSSSPDRTNSESLTDADGQGRRRQSHDLATSYSISRATRQASRFSSNTLSPSSSVADAQLPKDIMIKREPLGDDAPMPSHHLPHNTARRNSDSTLEETTTASSSKSYQISALIDIPPMAPPLNRASRTSSLSSSLSSFRFGGSLSQLWASQISLSGKINNMKSTGNLNADAAVMPSLGNQYFAFGGSLPELSLTSLTRLLPNSSASDPGLSSCPGLFTLPLYVYPSQQHLATPFINTHGSITFGSFLSSGSSLCSTSKGPIGGSAGSNVSTSADTAQSPAASGSVNVSRSEDEKVDGCGQVASGSTSSLHESVIKLPMYSPLSGTLLSGGGEGATNVVASLPSFSTLTRGLETTSMDVSTSNSIASANLPVFTASSSSSLNNQNLNSLGQCLVANAPNSLQLHPHPRAAPHPHHLPLHNQTRPHIHVTTPDHPAADADKHLPVQPLSPVQSYMGQDSTPILQTVPISRIKMESDIEPLDLSPAHGLPIMSPEGAQIHSPHAHSNMELQANRGGKVIKKEKDKPYKCDHPGCGRSFSFPAHLRSHIQQIHISYRPCKCEFPGCGKRFYTPQHLNVHRRVHTGERPFVCPYAECSKAFTTAGNLKNHIRTHTGERPYACKFEGCSKRFAEMSSLKKHELTHTGEKPYKCRVCGKAFSQAGSRNTHERKHNRTSEEEDGSGSRGGSMVAAVDGTLSAGGGGVKGLKKYRIKRVSGVEEPMQQ